MNKVILKSLFCFVVVSLMLPGILQAQYNAHSLYKDIIGSTSHSSNLNSAAAPKILEFPAYGDFSINSMPSGGEFYAYNYTPGISEGETKAVIEYYREHPTTGELVPDFTTIYFRITPSLISCRDDRITVAKNSGVVSIDVLENDSRTDGPLLLESIIFSENGVTNISNGKIDFAPDTDFTGEAYVYYVVRDAVGKSGTGAVKVKIVDYAEVPKKLNLDYVTYGGGVIELDLPFSGFSVQGSLNYGTFKNENGRQVYVPYNNQSFVESFLLVANGINRNVTIKSVYKPNTNSWVIDDVRYTSKGTPVTLDVTANDLKRNETITNHSSHLQTDDISSGVFTYTPPYYFSGSKKMSYTVSDGFNSETGFVTVNVNNFNPQTKYQYDFLSIGNAPLVINYNIPISNFSFEILQMPQHGDLVINDGLSTINFACDVISGNNLIIYDPNYNYIGQDDFKVRYCVDDKCKTIDVSVDVVPNDGEDCRCYTGCVWAGDANNDGVVNATDLITMAYAFGATGEDSEVNSTYPWSGRKAIDWNLSSASGLNAKYSDSDGSGVVDQFDIDAIEENYDKNHALVPPQFEGKKNFPFTLQLEDDTVYAGDIINFNIGIGNDFYPALDVSGLSYSLGFPASFVDSASFKIDYYSDSWFGIDAKVAGITKQIRTGWVESAVARLSKSSHSGAGTLAKASFIVEEDVVGGFRVKSDGIIPLIINASDIRVMTDDGEISTLEDMEVVVYIKLEKRSKDFNSELLVFPNPASDYLNIHMNGGHDITSFEVYNMAGQKLSQSAEYERRSEKISLANYDQGIYVLKVQTTSGVRIDRFEVLK